MSKEIIVASGIYYRLQLQAEKQDILIEALLLKIVEELEAKPVASSDINYAGDAERAEFQRFMEDDPGE